MLSDTDILKEIKSGNIICQPLIKENLSNSSIDLRLGAKIKKLVSLSSFPEIRFMPDENGKVQTVYDDCEYQEFDITDGTYTLEPGEFILCHTLEVVGSNCNFIGCQVADKSTMARVGISTMFNAGYIDVNNHLSITLEIKNNNNVPITLSYGQHIAQIVFFYTSSPCSKVYNGKYLYDKSVQEGK